MNWWQTALLLGAVGVVIWFSSSAVRGAKDEAILAQAKVVYDSTIAALSQALPAVAETIYVHHTEYQDDPAVREWADSVVNAAKADSKALALELYKKSVNKSADTNVVQDVKTAIGSVVYRSDVHQEYSPMHESFVLVLHNSRVDFPELTQTGIKTIFVKPAFWEKPLGILGGAACGYGMAKGDVGYAAVGGAAALISIVIDQ